MAIWMYVRQCACGEGTHTRLCLWRAVVNVALIGCCCRHRQLRTVTSKKGCQTTCQKAQARKEQPTRPSVDSLCHQQNPQGSDICNNNTENDHNACEYGASQICQYSTVASFPPATITMRIYTPTTRYARDKNVQITPGTPRSEILLSYSMPPRRCPSRQ